MYLGLKINQANNERDFQSKENMEIYIKRTFKTHKGTLEPHYHRF